MNHIKWLFALSVICTTAAVMSCTNLQLDPLNDRMDDNFSGNYKTPGDVVVGTPNNFSFAVLSDTHEGSPGGRVYGSFLDRIKAENDVFVLVGGDITDSGTGSQFDTVINAFQSRGLPFRAALGNHDIFFGGWTNFRDKIGRSVYSFNAGVVHFSVLDTANGVLGERQLDWLENDLSGTSQPLKVVITHFPPWNNNFAALYRMASDEEAAALKDMLSRHNVTIMFSGHYHGYAETSLGGVKYIVTGGANDLIEIGNHQHYFRVTVTGGSSMQTDYVPFP